LEIVTLMNLEQHLNRVLSEISPLSNHSQTLVIDFDGRTQASVEVDVKSIRVFGVIVSANEGGRRREANSFIRDVAAGCRRPAKDISSQNFD
jgi:hypothetical protein